MRKAEPQSYRLGTNPYLVKSLDISTGHLTKKDNDLLDEASTGESENPVVAYRYEYGHLVFCNIGTDDFLAIAKYGYSTQFVSILQRANELGCKYVQFDSEGIGYDDLETFSW
jgi:hypothetical protein